MSKREDQHLQRPTARSCLQPCLGVELALGGRSRWHKRWQVDKTECLPLRSRGFHTFLCPKVKNSIYWRTFLAVQWLRLCASRSGGTRSIPGWGATIPRAAWYGEKVKKKKLMKIKVSQSNTLPYYVGACGLFFGCVYCILKKMFAMNSYSWVTTCSLKKTPLRNQRMGIASRW